MTHLFLSPHLDDAVFSCGGLIHQLTSQSHRVIIQTVMAGDPPKRLPQTPLIDDLHQRWDSGEHPIVARREEDRAAAMVLGAEVVHHTLPDCPYRVDLNGNPLYTVNDDLFGKIHPQDPAWEHSLDISDDVTMIYAPLGAGGHVDHQIVSRLAMRYNRQVMFYEEYPYSAESGEAVRITRNPDVQQVGNNAIQVALSQHPCQMVSRLIMLDAENLDVKVKAMACYKSQISTFWDDLNDMQNRVQAYAQQVAPNTKFGAERLWFCAN